MPTYEYACRNCGKHLEVVQSFSDDPLDECPACAGPLRKVYGQIGIVFKGNGFYKTDSRTTATAATATAAAAAKSADAKAPPSKDAGSSPSKGGAKTAKPGKSGKSDSSKGTTSRTATAAGR